MVDLYSSNIVLKESQTPLIDGQMGYSDCMDRCGRKVYKTINTCFFYRF